VSNCKCTPKLNRSDARIKEDAIRHLAEAKKDLEYHTRRKVFLERDLVDAQRKIDCKRHVWEFYGHGVYNNRLYKCRSCNAMNSDEE
jgi:hypothetical protein